MSEVYFFEDKIWVVSSESYSNNKENAIKKMTEIALNEAKNALLETLLDESQNSEDLISSIKTDNNFLYEFKYDITLREFRRIIGYSIEVSELPDKDTFLKRVWGEDEKFVIFVERVRKPDGEFISFDEPRIKKALLIEKRSMFYQQFTNDLMEKTQIKLNDKYFQ